MRAHNYRYGSYSLYSSIPSYAGAVPYDGMEISGMEELSNKELRAIANDSEYCDIARNEAKAILEERKSNV